MVTVLKYVSFSVDILSFLKKKHLLFCQYQFLAQKLLILGKKNSNVWRNVDFFFINSALLLKAIIFWQNMLLFRKMCLFSRSIYINNATNSDKNFNFSQDILICTLYQFSLKYLICLEIVILIQNIILCIDLLDKSIIFPVKSTFYVV